MPGVSRAFRDIVRRVQVVSVADSVLLEMRGISKGFPGVRALDGVDFVLRRGEIHALMGENGAGKSTLIKILTGVYRRDAGTVNFAGKAIDPHSPMAAESLGISTVYQEINLIPHLSVAENICLGRQATRGGMIRWGKIRRRAVEALARLGVTIDVTREVASYSIAIQQMVAIARALDIDAGLLVLDEPTSSLDESEVEELFTVLRRLRDDGLGIVFITHFIDQVYAVSDRITVLRDGRLVGEYETAGLAKLELVGKMIGRDPQTVAAMTRESPARGRLDVEPLVEVSALARRGSIEAMDMTIGTGQVVGLAGLLGSGRSEVARLLFGVDRPDAGRVLVDGQPLDRQSGRIYWLLTSVAMFLARKLPAPLAFLPWTLRLIARLFQRSCIETAIRVGFGFTPEDRKVAGIVPNLSVRENIMLALQARGGYFGALSKRKQGEVAAKFIDLLGIKTPGMEQAAGNLSGGNQQKVLLARWLAMAPRLLILDEPTRGIDVGAKAEIEKLMGTLCDDGMSVLFISAELEEVVRDSHRVVVLRDHKKVGELVGEQIDLRTVMALIAGHENG